MPVFPKPSFPFTYDVNAEIKSLRQHKVTRGIPLPDPNKLLIATWNIANFGAQSRRDGEFSLIAEILGWFDIVAIQECRENYKDLYAVKAKLPKSYRALMSDVAGNNERMVYLYNADKLTPMEEIGEITFPPSQYKDIKLPGITQLFGGFDRAPFLATFSTGKTSFTFVNSHLFYGDEKKESIGRRALETYAVAKWSERQKKSVYCLTKELVALGDFNMPKSDVGDPIYNALIKLGLELPEHSTQIASSISSDSNYDQIAFFPDTTKRSFTGKKGVFDYDTVLFPALWKNGTNATSFKNYLRYYISDHRPMWVQMSI